MSPGKICWSMEGLSPGFSEPPQVVKRKLYLRPLLMTANGSSFVAQLLDSLSSDAAPAGFWMDGPARRRQPRADHGGAGRRSRSRSLPSTPSPPSTKPKTGRGCSDMGLDGTLSAISFAAAESLSRGIPSPLRRSG
jgi:hypothetical protein